MCGRRMKNLKEEMKDLASSVNGSMGLGCGAVLVFEEVGLEEDSSGASAVRSEERRVGKECPV